MENVRNIPFKKQIRYSNEQKIRQRKSYNPGI